ncbi:MAG: HAMP domain-containing protein [Acaryochloridaceae cyanobacterium SU_2_1]|nr:HAMP domain-containing protein [Acaryochloridaceae cyanobacterium SU_2_1]NJM95000.1 HAMP domain-containing protein [Acaryochloridaceae cyanobacterium CSU_5_19]
MRLFTKLSIQSKLTLMLLGVSISSILVIAYIGYNSGKTNLTRSIFNQLTSLRAAKSYEVQNFFDKLNRQARFMSINPATTEAMVALKKGYENLNSKGISPERQGAIRTYYQQEFIPQLTANSEGDPQAKTFQPIGNSESYLQYHYTITSSDFEKKAKVNDPGDGSLYSKAHRQFHPVFRQLTQEFQYEDFFLIDAATGKVVYTVYKGVDFGTDLNSGPYAKSVLAQAYQQVLQNNEPKFVTLTDFAPYRPSYDQPTAIIASPIFQEGKLIGIMALQINPQEIDRVMTNQNRWQETGLGKSGETYLVGSDHLLRSNSRFLLQDPEAYFKNLQQQGASPTKIKRMQRQQNSILEQEVKTEATEQAALGNSGIARIEDYRGVPVLSSYARLKIENLDWSILAQINTDEAFEPIFQFQKRVLISTALLILVITVLALFLSRLFVQPIQKLMTGFQQLGAGKTTVRVEMEAQDEFQDLGSSFNRMVENLQQKNNLLKAQSQENEKLLTCILPAPVAERLKKGEENIADSFPNVTVLFADLLGFNDLADLLPATDLVALLNDLVSAFDEAAERSGVEKIKTFGSGYMAVCGLSVPKLDHTKRIVDFGLDMTRIVERFNQTHQTMLKARVGVNCGAVVAGIVGRSKFIYDLWGDTVTIAYRMQSAGQGDAVQISQMVYEQLGDVYEFESSPAVEVRRNEKVAAWILKD